METLYANVILPLKLQMEVSYIIPAHLHNIVKRGSFIKANIAGRDVVGVVTTTTTRHPGFKGEIKEFEQVLDIKPMTQNQFTFIDWVSKYYMCTKGEVLKAASGNFMNNPHEGTIRKKRSSKNIKEKSNGNTQEIILSAEQQAAFRICTENISKKIPTLVKGVTGSGKTELYMHLAQETLSQGKSVLYMVPEVALSRQLTNRLEKQFQDKLHIFHSKISAGARNRTREALRNEDSPVIVLGLRSSVFLPFQNLGLVIVDEEHDSSYKQNEPAPRYNGRDSALMLAKIFDAGVILGSATPSLESLYNYQAGRYGIAILEKQYHSAKPSSVEIIDTLREKRNGSMTTLFSKKVLKAIEEKLSNKEQVLVFRNRRSYSPMVQCMYCGDIPSCSNCNVSLNYHKNKGTLECHYCQYSKRFANICTSCGKPGLKERGCGTEMIEEELRHLFPNAVIGRLDAETTSSKSREEKILKEFAGGNTDILVGTQMVSKGFDFDKLSLIVLVQADSMLSSEDFRAGEKAMQMLVQLAGRGGRRDKQGHIMVQTAQPQNRIYTLFAKGKDGTTQEMEERKLFKYPPYVRYLKIIVKHRNKEKLDSFAKMVAQMLPKWGVDNFTGPVPPPVEWVKREYITNFWIKLERKNNSSIVKSTIFAGMELLVKGYGKGATITFDPDPL
ncbi:MAG: primosomal protein N' [Bacteroidia bacterium]|nr:primosomal protein N' [Bacteroidia bacterium]